MISTRKYCSMDKLFNHILVRTELAVFSFICFLFLLSSPVIIILNENLYLQFSNEFLKWLSQISEKLEKYSLW